MENNLTNLGFTPARQFEFDELGLDSCDPCRVIRSEKGGCLVLPGEGRRVTLNPKLMEGPGRPVTGDWIAVDQAGVARAVLVRKGSLARGVDEGGHPQVLAANLDKALLVMALDQDFSLSRLDRFVVLCNQGEVRPIVVLTKPDLCEQLAYRVGEVEGAWPALDVLVANPQRGEGVEKVADCLSPGETAVLLGSSGVGKSTLINALKGEEFALTGEVRSGDGKGKHTTTWRELISLASGALLIDTPGLREVGLWADEESLELAFEDIAALAAGCRFNDCGHTTEPGCAVVQAVKEGSLEAQRLNSYLKLQKEISVNQRRKNVHEQREFDKSTMGKWRKELKVMKPQRYGKGKS